MRLKAHPDVYNILLQILEDGRLTDNAGRIVDFKNTVIIMTSNIGSHHITPPPEGASEEQAAEHYESMRETVTAELQQHFRPELLNRIDEVIVFHSLTSREIREIVDLMLSRVGERLGERISRSMPPTRRRTCRPSAATILSSAPGRCGGSFRSWSRPISAGILAAVRRATVWSMRTAANWLCASGCRKCESRVK